MPRYVDGEALLDWIIDAYADWCVNPIRGVFDHIKEMPTADVVEVVRCKDCDWYDETYCPSTLTPDQRVCKALHIHVGKDDYCLLLLWIQEKRKVSE